MPAIHVSGPTQSLGGSKCDLHTDHALPVLPDDDLRC